MTKCPQKKLKLKNCFLNLLSPIFCRFFNFNFFWGHFVNKVSLLFWNQHKILDFLIPYMTFFKKKFFHLSEGPIFTIYQHKSRKIILYIFCHSKTPWSKAIFKNFVKITGPYCTAKFLQDSARCHKAKKIMKFLEEQPFQIIKWPGNSPDLNPRENMWNFAKDKLKNRDTSSVPKLKAEITKL